MKKLFTACLFMLLFIGNVFAEDENKLYFSEDGKELVYDSTLFDEEIFMHHVDLRHSQLYKDTLVIENGSENTCELFFKVIERQQNELSDELLSNISMQIYIDDVLIYDGTAKGKDIKGDNVNLQDTISLGTFEPNKVSKLLSVTKLVDDYNNGENTVESHIDWQFYAQCAEKEVLPINPDTGDKIGSTAFVALISIVIILMLSLFYYGKKLTVK